MNLPDARKVAEGWRKALIKFAGAPVGKIGKIGQALVRLDLEIDARDNAKSGLIDCFVHGKGRDAACRDCFLMDRG